MTHLTEEQLILHYYGEESDALAVEQHLEGCDECRHQYGALQRVLNVVDTLPVPERGPEYESQVWRRISGQVQAKRQWWVTPRWRWAAAMAASAVLLATGFFAGRLVPGRRTRPAIELAVEDPQTGKRVLLVALSDYLERSQMVLVELSNARTGSPMDISAEQARVEDLVSESRLYRASADRVGDRVLTGALDDLDRVLLEVAHSPSRLSAEQAEELRERLKAEGILFKIRVLDSNFRNQEEPAAKDRQRL
jgi:hypothetical protein